MAWNRGAWLALWGTGVFLFVHTLLHPQSGLYGTSSRASLFSVLVLFVAFGVFSALFWAYFRYRRPRPPAELPILVGPPEAFALNALDNEASLRLTELDRPIWPERVTPQADPPSWLDTRDRVDKPKPPSWL
jgi:hypothetical protein